MQSPLSSSTTTAALRPFHKLLPASGDAACLPTSPAHSTVTLPPLPAISLTPPHAVADALKHRDEPHHHHHHHHHIHHDEVMTFGLGSQDEDDHGTLASTMSSSPTPLPPPPAAVAAAQAAELALPSPPSPAATSDASSSSPPPDADKMEILPSPLLWEALCSVVDADEDEPDVPPPHSAADSWRCGVPNDDANRFSTRLSDVGDVDWDHMDALMGTHEYGAWR